jgi:hypothetical protein
MACKERRKGWSMERHHYSSRGPRAQRIGESWVERRQIEGCIFRRPRRRHKCPQDTPKDANTLFQSCFQAYILRPAGSVFSSSAAFCRWKYCAIKGSLAQNRLGFSKSAFWMFSTCRTTSSPFSGSLLSTFSPMSQRCPQASLAQAAEQWEDRVMDSQRQPALSKRTG